MRWDERSLTVPRQPPCRQAIVTPQAFSELAITSVPAVNRPRQVGGVFAQHNPLGVCVFGRHLGAVVGFEPRLQGLLRILKNVFLLCEILY